MKYQIKMMSGEKLKISEETFKNLAGQTGLVHLRELNAIINLNSVSVILPEELADQDRKRNRDGQWCIRKFGVWVLENSPETRIDLRYYPELEGGEIKKEIPSSFAKKLSDKM